MQNGAEISITIKAKTIGDFESAIDEVRRLVLEGYRESKDSNETGSFAFNIKGQMEDWL